MSNAKVSEGGRVVIPAELRARHGIAINHAEVVARLLERAMREAEADAVCDALPLQVLPFTAAQARASGRLRPGTRALGLSLDDRCCLALAQEHRGAQVVTANRLRKDLKCFKITLIR